MKTNADRVQQFCNSLCGQDLLSKHSLTESGLWRVLGEDPNCDLAGNHLQPDLGIFEGQLKDVIAYAVELPGWYQWGSGGSIEPYHSRKIKKITADSVRELAELRARKKLLEAELKHIQDELDR